MANRLLRWRPRFRIASLLWLLVVAAVVFAWRRDRARLAEEIESLRSPAKSDRWGVEQATGPPDTPRAGDIPTAWASQTPDGRREWLLLEYDAAVCPTAIVVHETYNPGAVVEVSAYNWWGTETVLWRGVDPILTGSARGVSRIAVSPDFNTRFVKITLDSPKVGGWNEIDAVGLQTSDGVVWASQAYASTAYGANNTAPGWFSP